MIFKVSTATAIRLLVLSLLVICLSGCVDRSYQAPIPDYSNMTDGGSEYPEDSDE